MPPSSRNYDDIIQDVYRYMSQWEGIIGCKPPLSYKCTPDLMICRDNELKGKNYRHITKKTIDPHLLKARNPNCDKSKFSSTNFPLEKLLSRGAFLSMLQNSHGISIPALVPPCFEEPGYGVSTNATRVPFSVCQPHYPQASSIVPSARTLQEVMYPNDINYPGYLSDMSPNQSLPLPWLPSWHQRQNLPYLSHPHSGDFYPYGPEFGEMDEQNMYPPKRKRARTTFSAEQLKKLEKRFLGNHYIVGLERQKIAKELELSEAQVKVWFQNRRIKFKRDEELEKLGKSKKRKGEHHVRKWQMTTRHFGPETNELFYTDYDNTSRKHN